MMTIRVLGEYTGLSAGYLSMLEQNKTSPNVDSLARICEALDIDIQYALEGEMPGKTVIHREEMSKHLYPEENMTVEVADFGQGESIFAGKRDHIGIIGRLLEYTPCNVKSAVEGQTFFHIDGLFHKALHDIRHAHEGQHHPGDAALLCDFH